MLASYLSTKLFYDSSARAREIKHLESKNEILEEYANSLKQYQSIDDKRYEDLESSTHLSFLGREALILAYFAKLSSKELLKIPEQFKKYVTNDRAPLIYAAAAGNIEAVKKLATAENTNQKDKRGVTALMYAAFYGHTEIVKYLVEKCKLNIEEKDLSGRTALMYAAIGGNADVLQALITLDANVHVKTYLDQEQERVKSTALILAARHNNLEALKILLQQDGIEVDVKGQDWFLSPKTALMYAAQHGNVEAIDGLYEKGAVIDEVNVIVTPLKESIFATEKEKANTEQKLLKPPEGKTALMYAAQHGKLDAINKLLELGADIKIQDEQGRTALALAAMGGYARIVKVLVEKGADVNVICEEENHTKPRPRTPLMHAAAKVSDRKKAVATINALATSENLQPNIKDEKGRTAFFRTAVRRGKGVVDRLNTLTKIKGIDVCAIDNKGNTALMHVVSSYGYSKKNPSEIVQATAEAIAKIEIELISSKDLDFYKSSLYLTALAGKKKEFEAIAKHFTSAAADINSFDAALISSTRNYTLTWGVFWSYALATPSMICNVLCNVAKFGLYLGVLLAELLLYTCVFVVVRDSVGVFRASYTMNEGPLNLESNPAGLGMGV